MESLPAEAGGRLWADLPDWRVKFWQFPDGGELVAYRIGYRETQALRARLTFTPPSPRSKGTRGASQHREENREACGRRAKTTMRRRIRAGAFMRMWTFTYRENMQDRDRLGRDWKAFVRRMDRAFGEFHYVAVPERQERGAWHLHVAVKGFYHGKTVNRLWWATVGERMGNVDFGRNTRVNGQPSTVKVARYMGKYMGKSFDDGEALNKKRYWASEAVSANPVMQFTLEPDHFPAEDWMGVLNELWPMVKPDAKGVWVSEGGGVIWLSR